MITRTGVEQTVPVRLASPLDLDRSAGFLLRNGDDLMDRWDGRRLVRLIRIGTASIPLAMRSTGTLTEPELTVTAPADSHPDVVTTAVRDQFAPVPDSWPALLAADRWLAERDAAVPGVRLLGLTDPLYSLVRSITAQQVNLKFANRIRARLAEAFGRAHHVDGTTVLGLDADRLAGADMARLREMQLSERKASYLITAAQASTAGLLDPAALGRLDDEDFLRVLTGMRGIGRWTAEWFGVRVLYRPFLVAGDVALRKAVGRLYDIGMPSEAEVRLRAAHWGAATHVAAQLVLETCL